MIATPVMSRGFSFLKTVYEIIAGRLKRDVVIRRGLETGVAHVRIEIRGGALVEVVLVLGGVVLDVPVVLAVGTPTALVTASRSALVPGVLLVASSTLGRSAPFSTGSEKLDRVGDDVCGVTCYAVFFIGRGLEPAFHVNRFALGQIASAGFTQFGEGHDAVPFGFLFLFTGGLVVPVIGGGHAEPCHGHAGRGVAHLGVLAKIPNDHYLV